MVRVRYVYTQIACAFESFPITVSQQKAPAHCRVGRHRGDNVGALNECVRHVYERWLTGLKVFQNDQTIGSESSAFKVSGFNIFFGMATS